jgi:hypothetical protein
MSRITRIRMEFGGEDRFGEAPKTNTRAALSTLLRAGSALPRYYFGAREATRLRREATARLEDESTTWAKRIDDFFEVRIAA